MSTTTMTPPPAENIASLESRIHSTVDEIYRQQSFALVGRSEGLNMAVSPDEARLLQQMVEKFGSRNTIETGMGTGLSAVHMLLGITKNGGGSHTAVDPYQQGPLWNGLGLHVVEHFGFRDMFTWVCEKSDIALPAMVSQGRRFDLAFIDGNHRFEGALIDFYYIDQMLDVDGIVMFDDSDWPSVRRAVTFALRHRHYEWVGGSKVNLGPLTRRWGWQMRSGRRARYRKLGWPTGEANNPPPYETMVLRKVKEDDRPWTFWASLE